MTGATRGRVAGARRLVSSIARGQRGRLTAAVLLDCAYQALDLLVPVLVGVVVDQVVGAAAPVSIGATLLALLAVFGLRSTSYRFGHRATQQTMVAGGERLRRSLMARLIAPGDAERPHASPGTVASVANVDTEQVSLVGLVLPRIASTAVGLVVVCVALVVISPWLGLTTVVTGLLGSLALTAAARRVSVAAGEDRDASAAESALAEDICQGMRVVRGVGATGAVRGRYHEASARARVSATRAAAAAARHRGVSTAVAGTALAVGAGLGVWLVMRGAASVGALVTSVGLLRFVQNALEVFGWAVAVLSQGAASADKITRLVGDVVDEPPAPVVTRPAATPGGAELVVDGLTAGPLTELSFRVGPGEVLGLVVTDARVGAELRACLEGRAPRAGHVRATGEVLVVDESSGVLADTFVEDLSLLTPSSRLVDDAIGATLTGEVLSGLAARAEQPGAQTARVVSGGERQRLALLRALVARPGVLVVWEATTALDPATELHVTRSVARLRADAVTLVVTTSPIALAGTTRVLLVDGTAPVAGDHDELTRTCPRYRRVVQGVP